MTAVALLLMVKAVDEKESKAGCCSHPFWSGLLFSLTFPIAYSTGRSP